MEVGLVRLIACFSSLLALGIAFCSVAICSASSVLLEKAPCEFDCLNGRCDARTRSCVCSPGWLGAGCDLCAFGTICERSAPSLGLILPQAAPTHANNNMSIPAPASSFFLFVHGNAFPRGREVAAYSCLFGPSASPGHWLSSSLVVCPFPKPSPGPGKFAFSLVLAGTNKFIASSSSQQENGELSNSNFVHFFVPCQPSRCRGSCLGPLCLCPHSRTGEHCQMATIGKFATGGQQRQNGTEQQPQTIQIHSNDSSLGIATEFRPYLAKLPVEGATTRLELESVDDVDAPGLALDPLEGILYWASPRGRSSQPYSIGVRMDQPAEEGGGSRLLNWTLRVRPTYAAKLDDRLGPVNGSNARLVSGRVLWAQGASPLNGSVPLLLRIASGTDSSSPLDQIPLWTSPDQPDSFIHQLFPFLGIPTNSIGITVHHPGWNPAAAEKQFDNGTEGHSADSDGLQWTQERVQVDGFPTEVPPPAADWNGSLALNYSLRLAPSNEDCHADWQFEVVQPREYFAVQSSTLTDGGVQVQLVLKALVDPEELRTAADGSRSADAGLPLQLAFICNSVGQSRIIRQTLKGLSHVKRPVYSVELSPRRLFVPLGSALAGSVFSLDIVLPPDQADLLRRENLESAQFAPFFLVWLSRPSPLRWRLWLALKGEERLKGGGGNGDSDGALLIRGAENLVLSVPYRLQQPHPSAADGTDQFMLTLTVKCPLLAAADTAKWQVDVELYDQGREQQFIRAVQLNEPSQLGPLRTGLFQLRIRSRHLQPFSSLIPLSPLDNAFIAQLEPRPSQYFAFDGQHFFGDWEQGMDQDQPSPPVVRLNPAVFGPNVREQFLDVVYSSGPAQSFVSVRPDSANWVSLPMTNSSILCLGCGFRQRVLVRPPVPANCSALAVSVHFLASLPSGLSPNQLPFFQHILLINRDTKKERSHLPVEQENELPNLCGHSTAKDDGAQPQGVQLPLPPLALRTPIPRHCPLARLRQCRSLFRSPGAKCQHRWRDLPDALLSVHTLAQLLLLTADCLREGSGPDQMLRLVQCIAAVDRECPLHPADAEMAPHLGGQLFNQMGFLKPFRSGLQSLFPALGLVESQLVNFPSLLADFLKKLQSVFPIQLVRPFFLDSQLYDLFIASISDHSPNATLIDRTELEAMPKESLDLAEQIARRWNELVTVLKGDQMDLLDPGSHNYLLLSQIRELINGADRLKSVTRQFGAENPFALFRDVLAKIFANVAFYPETSNSTAEGDWTEQVIGWLDVRADPLEVTEGEEFRLIANLQTRPLLSSDLGSIRAQLHFAQPSLLRFRVGPVFNSGPTPLGSAQLRPGEMLTVEWTVLAVPELRLTDSVNQKIDLLLTFELEGQRKAQRVRAPSVRIRPKPSLRLLAFARPVLPSPGAPFSLLFSAINSGYSVLRSVQLLQFRPSLVAMGVDGIDDGDSPPVVDFRISGIGGDMPEEEEGSQASSEAGHSLTFNRILSGKAAHLLLNISLDMDNNPPRGNRQQTALFRSLSLLVSVDGSFLPPAQFDQRFFLVQDMIRGDHSLMLVSEHLSPQPLYLFSKRDSSLTPLATLQLIEEKESRPSLNGHQLLSRVFALRRLALFPSPASVNGSHSPVLASIRVDSAQTFADGAKLLRVAELGQQGRQRPLDMRLVWVGEASDDKTTLINFIDSSASAAVPQLVYELLFGRPEHFRAPFFPQSLYRIHLSRPIDVSNNNERRQVLARAEAISPLGRPLTYSLWSPDEKSPFRVVPSTGDIVLLVRSLSPEAKHLCLNLAASDPEGHTAKVPLQITVLNSNTLNGGNDTCELFSKGEKLFSQEFKADEKEEEMETNDAGGLIVTVGTPTAEEEQQQQLEEEKGEEQQLQQLHWTMRGREQETMAYSQPTLATPPPTTVRVQEIGGDSTLALVKWTAGEIETTDEDNSLYVVTLKNTTPSADTGTTNRPMSPVTEFSRQNIPAGGRGRQQQSSPTSNYNFGGIATIQRLEPLQRGGPRTTPAAIQINGIGSGGLRTSGKFRGKNVSSIDGGRGMQNRNQQDAQANAAAMAENACRLRSTQPIWALICDMAKTAFRTANPLALGHLN